MSKKKIINVQGFEIRIEIGNAKDYISLTDLAKQRGDDEPRFTVRNWMSLGGVAQ